MPDDPMTPTLVPNAAPSESQTLASSADMSSRLVPLGPVHSSPPIPQVQLLYARMLRLGVLVGMVLLLVTFAIYITGLRSPAVPIDQLPNYWSMNAEQYLQATNKDFLHQPHPVTGWSWGSHLAHADYLNYLGITLLSAITIVCFLGILPTLLKTRDWIYAGMVLLEAIILILAASGILCCNA
jgi:hypothetical protein